MNARAVTRAEYFEARRVARTMRPTREERGLPRHPDGTGRADCPECEGAGEHTVNLSPDRDPQCEEEITCSGCAGLGWVPDGPRDPILDLRELRRGKRTRRPRESMVYGSKLARVTSPAYLAEILKETAR